MALVYRFWLQLSQLQRCGTPGQGYSRVLATWQNLWPRPSELFLHFKVLPLPMRKIFIFWVPSTGFSPSIKSCCMRHEGATRVCKEKGSDLAVGWSKLWPSWGVSHMWGEISPQWHLLRHHLWNRGPNYLNAQPAG